MARSHSTVLEAVGGKVGRGVGGAVFLAVTSKASLSSLSLKASFSQGRESFNKNKKKGGKGKKKK
jgi:hypothetical protein